MRIEATCQLVIGHSAFAKITSWGLCPKKGVWNFQALEIAAFIGLGEFRTPFFGQSPSWAK